MKRPMVAMTLAVAAALVLGENYVYFRGDSATPRPRAVVEGESAETDEPFDESYRREAGPSVQAPASLLRAQLADLLRSVELVRSPFLLGSKQHGGTKPEGSGLPRLAGTLMGNGRRIAWIDGRPRRVGELHGEFLVREIQPERVVLVRQGRRYTLEIRRKRADPEDAGDPGAAEATPNPRDQEGGP